MSYTSLTRTSAAPTCPVTLDEARAYLRVDTTADDAVIQRLLDWATELCERARGIALLTSTWLWKFEAWPDRPYLGAYRPFPVPSLTPPPSDNLLRVPRWPLQSVSQVQYLDPGGVLRTLDPSQYLVDPNRKAGLIFPAPGCVWPDLAIRADAAQVTFIAGYGAASDVPAGVKLWITRVAAMAYAKREEFAVPCEVYGLLDQYVPLDRS